MEYFIFVLAPVFLATLVLWNDVDWRPKLNMGLLYVASWPLLLLDFHVGLFAQSVVMFLCGATLFGRLFLDTKEQI